MRTSSVEAVVVLVSVVALLSLAPMAEAQVAAPDYVFLDTEQTSTLQRELQPPVPIICETTSLLRLVSGRGGFDG